MILCFTLSMPGAASWNGKWSGEGTLYAKLVNLGTSKRAIAKGEDIIAKKGFSYSWPDGWQAWVDVKCVTGKEAAAIRRKSKGFCGYDWMVDSIIQRGFIANP